ncbi:retron St85 family RNA-directed DNA polymerase [Salinicoccus siamensis]|uniref:RNA-directed DNA polymerase n=1 Tax=Salinicoccus siamensis TaxID=381830 RepID=A0ABV5Z480_9STAP
MDIIELEKNLRKHDHKEEILEYVKNLNKKEVPVIFDNIHLARLININEDQFFSVLFSPKNHMTTFSIPKKRNGKREISKPSPVLMHCQRWILDNILYKLKAHHKAKGFKKNISIVDNAKEHINKEYVLNIDIKDFFKNINNKKVFILFKSIGYSEKVSLTLSNLCTFNNYLPQGAPTSPHISNLILIKLDNRIEAYAQKNNLTYTRYADDITLSGSKEVYKSIKVISEILNDEGFEIKKEKTRVQPYYSRQEVTGLVVNDKVSVPKEYIKQLRQELYYIRTRGMENHLTFNDKFFVSNYREYILGKINFLKMVDSKKGNFYLNEFLEIWDKR